MTKYAVTLITPPGYQHWKGFNDVAQTLNCGLRNIGHDSMIRYSPDPNRRNIVLGSNLLKHYPVPLPSDSILYNLEQIENGDPTWINPEFIKFHQTYTTWDFCEYNAKAFDKIGIKVDAVLPMGYVDQATNIPQIEEKDIDAILIAGHSERRDAMMMELHQRGLKVYHVFPLYGKERDKLISRTKVLLNIQTIQPKILEIVRMAHYLANKCAVVSEKGCNFNEYESIYGNAITFTNYGKLADVVVDLCKNDTKRKNLASAGFEIFKAQRIEDHLRKILNEE